MTVVATAARLAIAGQRTVFEVAVTRSIPFQVFTLANPYRVVIDVPEMIFDLAPGAGREGRGLVSAFRYGLFAEDRSRIVIDATGPVRVVRSDVVPGVAGQSVRLQLELEAITPEAYAAAMAAVAPSPPAPPNPQTAPREPRPASGKFGVMIDPGHGGIDGGAVNGSQVVEKEIVLAVARQLKGALDAKGRFDVRMTRENDIFVSLDQRVAMSQAADANLFISIHADSVADAALARSARGASLYTLSETASNQAAQAFADKENAADAASGVERAQDPGGEQVNSILVDLMKRETQNFSLAFRQALIDRLRPINMLAREPARAAAFKVLRQTQTPTVLIELGFLTHETDAQQMQTAEWRKRIAGAIAAAVDAYFAKRSAEQR